MSSKQSFTVKENFSWAHAGVLVKEYVKGETLETNEKDLIEVGKREGWITPARAAGKAEQKKLDDERRTELQATIEQLSKDLADAADPEAEQAIEVKLSEARAELVKLG